VKPTIVIEDAERGDRWSFDLLHDRLECASKATCYQGRDAGGRRVFVKCVEPDDGDGLERTEREVEAHRRLGRHPAVLALLGVCVSPRGSSYRVFEWADVALHDLLAGYAPALRGPLADGVEDALRDALRAVHAAGLVHGDVAPNNVVRVAGRWKLADFDVCVPEGAPTVGQPRLGRYVTPGREVGQPARCAFDWDGLRALLADVRGSEQRNVVAAR
jgi:serine/threonine protein kinase